MADPKGILGLQLPCGYVIRAEFYAMKELFRIGVVSEVKTTWDFLIF